MILWNCTLLPYLASFHGYKTKHEQWHYADDSCAAQGIQPSFQRSFAPYFAPIYMMMMMSMLRSAIYMMVMMSMLRNAIIVVEGTLFGGVGR